VLALGGAAGLGVSLWFIHIYVAPLKKFIQASGDKLLMALPRCLIMDSGTCSTAASPTSFHAFMHRASGLWASAAP
jgi:hypothetical protein